MCVSACASVSVCVRAGVRGCVCVGEEAESFNQCPANLTVWAAAFFIYGEPGSVERRI